MVFRVPIFGVPFPASDSNFLCNLKATNNWEKANKTKKTSMKIMYNRNERQWKTLNTQFAVFSLFSDSRFLCFLVFFEIHWNRVNLCFLVIPKSHIYKLNQRYQNINIWLFHITWLIHNSKIHLTLLVTFIRVKIIYKQSKNTHMKA